MKKKHLITTICAITGAAVLFVSSIATYATASGYTAAKNAVKNTLLEDNFTLDTKFDFLIDGVPVEDESMYISQKFDKNGLVKYSIKENNRYKQAFQDGMSVRAYHDEYGTIKSVNVYDDIESGDLSIVWLYDMEDSEEYQSMIKFSELLCDTLIGDLKNNITLTGSTDAADTYSVVLDAYQIPPLYQAGLECLVAAEHSGEYYIEEDKEVHDLSEEEFYALIEEGEISTDYFIEKNANISSASMDISVDKQGRLSSARMDLNVSGEDMFSNPHTFTIAVSADLYDYGTTVCDRIDISDYREELLSENGENMHYISSNNIKSELVSERNNLARIDKDEELTDEEKEEAKERTIKFIEALEEQINSEEYIRYTQIRDSLLFDDLTDEERISLIEEKGRLVEKIKDPYEIREFVVGDAEEITEEYIEEEVIDEMEESFKEELTPEEAAEFERDMDELRRDMKMERMAEDDETEVIVPESNEAYSVGVIGGSDGPTEIFIADKV